jgi:hypothetical protein
MDGDAFDKQKELGKRWEDKNTTGGNAAGEEGSDFCHPLRRVVVYLHNVGGEMAKST